MNTSDFLNDALNKADAVNRRLTFERDRWRALYVEAVGNEYAAERRFRELGDPDQNVWDFLDRGGPEAKMVGKSPAVLYAMAEDEHPNDPEARRRRYHDLMVEHGHIVKAKPGEDGNLPCGWPHLSRGQDD